MNAPARKPVVKPKPARRAGTAAGQVIADCHFLLSHEMRSPLMVLQGFAQRLAQQHAEQLGPKGAAHLDRMQSAAKRMAAQTEGMVALIEAARRPLRPARMDLGAVFAEAARQLAADDPSRLVDLRIEPGLECEADADLAGLLAQALLHNAWKFTGRSAAPAVHVGAGPRRAGAARRSFFVADNGVGFEVARAGELFQAFRRMHGAHEFPGEGTGLALARIVVERHGGRIQAESSPDEGSCIRFTLPAPKADAA